MDPLASFLWPHRKVHSLTNLVQAYQKIGSGDPVLGQFGRLSPDYSDYLMMRRPEEAKDARESKEAL